MDFMKVLIQIFCAPPDMLQLITISTGLYNISKSVLVQCNYYTV